MFLFQNTTTQGGASETYTTFASIFTDLIEQLKSINHIKDTSNHIAY